MRIIRFISGIRLACIVLFVRMIWVKSYAQQKTIQLIDKNSQKAIADSGSLNLPESSRKILFDMNSNFDATA